MLTRNYLSNTAKNVIRTCLCGTKNFSYIKQYSSTTKSTDEESSLNLTLHKISSKYKVFKDSDAVEIPDVYEERYQHPELIREEPKVHDPFDGLNLERGVNGVFEIEDLVEVLEKENSQDIFVAAVSIDLEYVDFMCIVTGKSPRHMQAIADFVRKVYKRKRHASDIIPKIEGENSKDWVALDLGNIALHIFSKEARAKYDLDSLWAVGAEYDSEYNKEDPIVEMLERHSQCQIMNRKNS
ncbi:iojap superfamily [Holotrichia oblita]|uniref:Iojap superfamily n=1 Tax=Holotrichia oblita TaxID=644536 RepID=A0ACB9TBS8_HOLOL|nr:iojap superfamily [Holotrichia oblita]